MAALVGTFNEAITKNIWYRFSGPDTEAGMVEVSYTSLRAVYPVLDSYSFPLVRSRVRCVCDCPGGAAHCPADLCGNTTNCHTHYSPSVPSTGCFLSWLQLSASLCCSIQVSVTCHVSRVTRVTTDRAVQHAG